MYSLTQSLDMFKNEWRPPIIRPEKETLQKRWYGGFPRLKSKTLSLSYADETSGQLDDNYLSWIMYSIAPLTCLL